MSDPIDTLTAFSPRIDSAFCLDHGFALSASGDDWAEVSCDVFARHVNRHGNAHGGLVAALLDTAMGAATRASGEVDNFGTATLTVSYLRPARGRLCASASVLKRGGRLAFCEAVARDAAGDIVATASGVFAIGPLPASTSEHGSGGA
ncbi:PaaI family thioesterase [Burkholderia sp. Ac-20379]|uniref:PaaI family thioesterase n=1 Tax=Burkholderia sp. Ac-20379 TaxID=2703900 RepID=UPI00197FBC81|nr:PaaI family thioesterase [Burkholderia sp. Ac-20379]MBN3723282.1 PaaI family thioesterase [Burkholderia sp. Ac-20379]